MNTSRSAFTLVEMLIVIALLTTLMGLGAAGMRVADNMSKETRTRSTVQKLNQFVMEKYASYQYRRVQIPDDTPIKQRAKTRLYYLYDMMRNEMPDHWEEVTNYSPERIIQANKKTHNAELASAELLYQIVMGLPEAESAFSSMEIADTDGNGLNEFVDGWGNPICFVRWPAGHCNGYNNVTISKIQNDSTPNPFDIQNLKGASNNYAVFPLIFSCGSDRQPGIYWEYWGNTPRPSRDEIHPCYFSEAGFPQDKIVNGKTVCERTDYYDNITNHNL